MGSIDELKARVLQLEEKLAASALHRSPQHSRTLLESNELGAGQITSVTTSRGGAIGELESALEERAGLLVKARGHMAKLRSELDTSQREASDVRDQVRAVAPFAPAPLHARMHVRCVERVKYPSFSPGTASRAGSVCVRYCGRKGQGAQRCRVKVHRSC
jgi:hypothetical protein